MKIWNCICLLFLFYSIQILQDERFDVIYSVELGENITESIYDLVCLNVRQIDGYSNRTQIDQLRSDLYQHLERHFQNLPPDRLGDHSDLSDRSNLTTLVLDQITSKNYLFVYNLVCIITSGFKQQNKLHRLLGEESTRLIFKKGGL